MNNTEAIVEIKKVIAPEVIKTMIEYADKHCVKNLLIYDGKKEKLNKDHRNVKGVSLKPKSQEHTLVLSEIERVYTFYKAKFPFMRSNQIDQIDVLKYEKGGHFNLHVDYVTHLSRSLSIIINLNEDYEGGDLVFTDQKKIIVKRSSLKAGDVVFFPSNFLYPHLIEPVTNGTRYSIVSWLQ